MYIYMALEIPVIIPWHFRRNVLRLIPGEAATEATPPDGHRRVLGFLALIEVLYCL